MGLPRNVKDMTGQRFGMLTCIGNTTLFYRMNAGWPLEKVLEPMP